MRASTLSTESLPPPAHYFPVRPGPYVMKAGLARLGTPVGNGAADGRILQLDRQWARYRANKLQARTEALSKYYCAVPAFDGAIRNAVAALLLDTLAAEYPEQFILEQRSTKQRRLHCPTSGEQLDFDIHGRLTGAHCAEDVRPPYRDNLDALTCQIQEDLAVVSTTPRECGQVLMLHLCAPNHWAAGDRIGRSFQEAHGPVPQFQRVARHTPALLANLRDAGPYVRFAWGLATDPRLNHHPEPPPGTVDAAAWHGRQFDPAEPALYLRVERQVLVGIPAADCFVFAIRTYITPADELTPDQRRMLADAVLGMDEEIVEYKGLSGQQTAIAHWLRATAGR